MRRGGGAVVGGFDVTGEGLLGGSGAGVAGDPVGLCVFGGAIVGSTADGIGVAPDGSGETGTGVGTDESGARVSLWARVRL